MESAELYLTSDTCVWAEEFCRIAKENHFNPENSEDVDWVRTWFDNAMMHGYDRATGFREIAHALMADGYEIPKG